MLTKQLRELENDGVIRRTVYPEVPPRVEYAITEFGKTLIPVMQALCNWGPRILRSRTHPHTSARQKRERISDAGSQPSFSSSSLPDLPSKSLPVKAKPLTQGGGRLEFPGNEKIITAGIGAGIFLLITTYLIAFVLFGRLTGFIYLLLAAELLFTLLFSAIFLKRRYLWTTLARPVAAGILLSLLATFVVIVIGTTMIHAPLPLPESRALTSGRSVLMMAVPTDEITTTSPEAKELLIKGLTAASRNNGFEEAIRCYDQALVLDPDFTTAWIAKGVALHNLGSREDAIGCLDQALVLDPYNAGAWSLKGIILTS